jgi:biofilm PGA synthesis protein PgaD
MTVEDKLIYRPAAVDLPRRTLFGLATLAAWSLYLYLWLPLVTFALWALGGRTAYLRLFDEPPVVDYQILVRLLLIALGCALVLTGWAEYNRLRFQGKERRGHPPRADIHEVAQRLRADPAIADLLQSARIGTVVMDDAAVPTGVRVAAALPAP